MFFVGGGVAAFDCDENGLQDLYFAGGAEPAALFRNASPVGGALASTRSPSRDRPGERHRRLPARHRRRRDRSTSPCSGSARTCCCAVSATARSSGPTRHGATTAGMRGRPPSAPHGSCPTPCRRWPSAIISSRRRSRSARYVCDEHELVRPAADGGSYAPPVALTPGGCTLSMLFSDWDRSGRRDLRVSNDRHYYRFGQEQLWRMEPDTEPQLWNREEGWQVVRIWGMGIASQDITGDGSPRSTSPARRTTSSRPWQEAPSPATRTSPSERGDRPRAVHRGHGAALDGLARRVPGRQQRQLLRPLRRKGNVEAQPDYAMRDPSNLLIGQPDGTFVEGGMDAGIASFARARGAGWPTSISTGCSTRRRESTRERRPLAQRRGGTAEEPAPMGDWIALQLADEAPTATRSVPGSRSPSATG